MVDDSTALLKQYVRERSETAFAEIVRRYVDLVYASARRQVRDAELAQDVTQAVFLVLAQKAASVSTDRPLSAWLLRTTTYCAANARRAREHRQFHERKAAEMARETDQPNQPNGEEQAEWEQLAPLLDEGLNKLGAGERDAVILKYFEKKSLRQVGETLGISEEAATKRVSRAVERLRVFFQKRGTVVSGVALAALLASESAQAAPAGLAGTISTSAVGTAAGAGVATGAASMAKGAIILMATQKAKAIAVAAGAVLLGVGAIIVVKASHSSPSLHAIRTPVPAISIPQSATKTRWALTFSDGSTAEVMGICDPDAKSPQWWAVDGSAALVPSLKNLRASAIPVPDDQAKRQLVLRLAGNTLRDANLKVRLSPSLPMAIDSNRGGREMNMSCVFAVPFNVATADLSLGLSRGSWAMQETLNIDTPLPQQTPATPRLLTVGERDGQTTVDLADLPAPDNNREQRLYIELRSGKEVDATVTSTGRKNVSTYHFACAKSDVARIVLASRPCEWVKVTNVSLFPTGQLTDVKIERLPLPQVTQAIP